jgi:hypothetical protein
MPLEAMTFWLMLQQTDDVSNQLQHTSNDLAELWIECVNEQSESKLRLQFIPALWCYFQSHPPRDGYEGFLRVEVFDAIRDARDVSDAKHFWATQVELMRTHTAIISQS